MTDNKSQRFTIDSEKDGVEVPTLTQLLYKKNVVKSKSSAEQDRAKASVGGRPAREQDHSRIITLEPTLTVERPAPEISLGPAESTNSVNDQVVMSQFAKSRPSPAALEVPSAAPKVTRAAATYTPPAPVSSIPTSKIPTTLVAANGIRFLNEKTKMAAALVFEEQGDAFVLKAVVGDTTDRNPLWAGMEISKTAFGDLVGRLEKFGFAEFSTLGSAGQGNFDRAGFRTTFQAKNNEWVSLVRVKTAGKGSAILAFLTTSSIQMHLPAFHSAVLGAGAKAA